MRGLTADHGNVAVIVALMMTTLLAMGAIAVDVGGWYVRRQQLQTGADAAALAVAKRCAEFVVAGEAWQCNDGLAQATASNYVGLNVPVTATVPQPVLSTSYASRVGRVGVTATVDEPRLFSRMIEPADADVPVTVGATAIARWGPMTAVDSAFPIVVCKGALPEVGESVTLWSAPSGDELVGECDGAPDALPLGWVTPSDPAACTTNVSLVPPSSLTVAPSDTPPTQPGCDDAIDELLDSIAADEPANQRTRVLAVYDAGSASSRAHALVALEFTGARIGDREEHTSPDWDGVCDPGDTTYSMDELQCIRGTVVNYDPPEDGPIYDPSVLGPSGEILDTTVLDVRLVD